MHHRWLKRACTAQHYTAPRCDALRCSALHGTTLHGTALSPALISSHTAHTTRTEALLNSQGNTSLPQPYEDKRRVPRGAYKRASGQNNFNRPR